MSKVSDVIESGQPIPDDVTRVADKDEHVWEWQPGARWFCVTTHFGTTSIEAEVLSREWAPLRVTAVREPERNTQEPCEICSGFGCPDCDDSAPRPDPAPLVLSLPTVPDGAAGLEDRMGRRWMPAKSGANWELRSPDATELLNWRTLGNLLGDFGPLTVVMREPRTWPRLDTISNDLKAVRGASGKVYHRSHFSQSVPVFRERGNDGDPLTGPGHMFYALQTFDGPLTEVFDDEPGGEPR